jgi:nucleoside-diphosphate-sugar epimerase
MPEPFGKTKAEKPLMLALGLGFVAGFLSARLEAQGWQVVGTRRSQHSDGAVIPLEEAAALVPRASAVLSSIPPGESGDPALLVLASALEENPVPWIGYLSTTGVYGDRGGRWAFEDDTPTPLSIEAKRRNEAERAWRAVGGQVFRLPGIYCPGRSTFDKLRAGTERRIDKPGQIFSRAHADDIAAALQASMARPNPGRIYNICDDEPAPTAEVTAFAAQLLGIAPPPLVPFAQADLSPMGRRFYAECKRVSNARAKAELGWRPRFPTYREGLTAILQAETSATS